ncbi:YbaK/EbsC family protein [Baekduia soli]|uniref:YbaK/EbsC family protein n=1 Tax=Baekduia soli TaxID=496014 RepID=A0A5B8U1L1_9ACTN|nr:YbaK/EbsC family protein [Baekduia soli]QEC46705.1 YbaK/EbsC family protein [Baekduia soli]
MAGVDYPGARELGASAHTAAQAAAALGVSVAQIVKSLVFLTRDDPPAPVLVLCSGASRVDEAALGVVKARAETVREATGTSIGGVAPYGHPAPLHTIVDEDLMAFDVVWAAAGTATRVFPLTPAELLARTGGTVARVAP